MIGGILSAGSVYAGVVPALATFQADRQGGRQWNIEFPAESLTAGGIEYRDLLIGFRHARMHEALRYLYAPRASCNSAESPTLLWLPC